LFQSWEILSLCIFPLEGYGSLPMLSNWSPETPHFQRHVLVQDKS
jgi:hypothetical protein